MLSRARMKLENEQSQTALLRLGSLKRIVWDTCESLAEDPTKLEAESAFDMLIDLLDSRFRHDRSTELPE